MKHRSLAQRGILWLVFLSLCGGNAGVVSAQNIPDDDDTDGQKGVLWQRLEVDGAQCGDGSSYSVFLNPGVQRQTLSQRSRKVLFILSGGGACWSKSSCYGVYRLTDLQAPQQIKKARGIFSDDVAKNPFAEYTKVFFPYCTGDVYLGRHTARYEDRVVHHHGRVNFKRAVSHLQSQGWVDWSQNDEFVFYGYSSGALGSLYHALDLERLFTSTSQRTLLSDAPGLHFGGNFWKKFPPALIRDYRTGLQRVGVDLKPSQGHIAQIVPNACRLLPAWQIGVLQGSKDLVMTKIFGNIGIKEHEKLIFGPSGLLALTRNPQDNCSAWVQRSFWHAFLMRRFTPQIKAEGQTAMNYSWDIVQNGASRNYGHRNDKEDPTEEPKEL